MESFSPATSAWFREAFERPTAVQARGWPCIARGSHVLLTAPTGSGKTLAAFLWAIDRVSREPAEAKAGVRVLYISPLKALVYDIERNLRAPLAGIARMSQRLGADLRVPSVAVRTGDTSAADRRRIAKHPPDILVTTPESLYLMLTSQAREILRSVETVIVDEVHALAPTKRGAHLALSVERLCARTETSPQRIGLSATANPLKEVARYLGGDREVEIIDASAPPKLDLQLVVPVPDMTRPEPDLVIADERSAGQHGIWPVILPRLLDLIREHRTTIIFVNSRGLCERLAQQLNEMAGEDLVRSHHGSVSHQQRHTIEEALKQGSLSAIVATSSLELGIDMGAVDLVILVESPGAVSRGLQRVGRAGHGVGEVSRGRVFPKHRADLLEATVVGRRMRSGSIEALRLPRNPLDVLAQHMVAMTAMETWRVDDMGALVRRCASYRDLPEDALLGTLDMLAGRYPSTAFADLRPRISWDRDQNLLDARRGAKMIALISGGSIPDRGLYGVYLGADGPRLGELDEEMVHETQPGQTFTLGSSTWRVERITRDRVLVTPAPGEPGKLPFWHGEGPGRPVELGQAMGAFVRELDSRDPEDARTWLTSEYDLDDGAAQNLVAYVREQRAVTGSLPTDRTLTIERFRDEIGDYRVCILTPFGSRLHAPWGLALQRRLAVESGFEVQVMWTDDGIVLRFADGTDDLPGVDALIPEPEQLDELLLEQLGQSALFAAQFRENAARALLLPRRRPDARTPLWQQRLRSQQLLAVAREYPSFPIMIETYRSCLQDVFDVPGLRDLLRKIRSREVEVALADTPAASPFARSLVFAYVAQYLYEGDAPVAERRAQALALDRAMLRELLGEVDLRTLLDESTIQEVEAEIQGLAKYTQARDPDGVHDRLRRLGDLTRAELDDRTNQDPGPWLAQLERQRRVICVRIAAEHRYIAAEDAGLYRDALGVVLPPGVPIRFLEVVSDGVHQLLGRFARTRGPFRLSLFTARYGVSPGSLASIVEDALDAGALSHGAFRNFSDELCDAGVLRRIKRRTLAQLRQEVAAVEPAALGRFLPRWHGLDAPRRGTEALRDVVTQLEGIALPYGDLERSILPARVRGFQPGMLDELGASGWLVWVGHGSLGQEDGRVALYRRDHIAARYEPRDPSDANSDLASTLLDTLERRGACFFVELQPAAGVPNDEIVAALWDLVWAGFITNDTFQPLRGLGARGRGRRALAQATGGRWALVSDLLGHAPPPTECLHARVTSLLERHGLVSREVTRLESTPGGFGRLYPMLKELEEAGRVQRGHFAEGIGGIQFALPGAVDRLRSARSSTSSPDVHLLAATDPANPYGWLVAWPTTGGATSPRRVAGAHVVLVDGQPILFVDRGARRVLTFPGFLEERSARLAASALAGLARRGQGQSLRIRQIDDDPARLSPHADRFRAASFSADHAGLVMDDA